MQKKLKSPLRWQGGKARLADEIILRIPQHAAYVEACCGGAAVFWAKPKEASKSEILNDLDGELINFYSMLHKRGKALAREVDSMPYSRKTFSCIKASKPSGKFQRAVRFWYLNRVCFGARREKQSFGVKVTYRSSVLSNQILMNLDAIIERLRGVLFECLDITRLLEVYDRDTTFFYVDPPYYKVSQEYAEKCRFGDEDHNRLAFTLAGIAGKWILSYNDEPFIRDLYPNRTIIPLKHTWIVGCNSPTRASSKANEIIILKDDVSD